MNRAPLDVALYHCDFSPHFDLLTGPDSLLALEGSKSMRETTNEPIDDISRLSFNAEALLTDSVIADYHYHPIGSDLFSSTNDIETESSSTCPKVFNIEESSASPRLPPPVATLKSDWRPSPLTFPPCPRGPGRPKVRREGAPTKKRKRNAVADGENPSSCLEPDMLKKYKKNINKENKKKRGRPIGSKNKKPKTSSRHLSSNRR